MPCKNPACAKTVQTQCRPKICAKVVQTFLSKLKATGNVTPCLFRSRDVRQKQLEKLLQSVIILIYGNTTDSRRAG